ncbi:MAG: S8 family serine peptidase [Lachnospiraceae bacterium]|nr:S8 family serine peptidase [Lachnospiraceae bacterium]
MNQKLENLLNLALETPENIREQTDNLNVGFASTDRTWELIVKYHGSLDYLITLNIRVEYLIAGYAILTVPEQLVDSVAEQDEIEYVEKPKRYYYSVPQLTMTQLTESVFSPTDFLTDACIYPVTRREPFLSGDGVLIAVIDSGIDYARREFRTEDGSTRILSLWDQTAASGQPPAGFFLGSEYSEAQINMALAASTPTEKMQLVPSIDVSGHGTAVAGIAAGYSPESTSEGTYRYEGLAPNSKLLIVKLGLPSEEGFPRTTEIMRGVTYAIRKALELGMPLVINLSFGNSYGSHDGSSLLERFLDNASEIGRTVICVGSGNEGNSAGHAAGNALSSSATVDLAVADYESSLSVQLWTQYSDSYRIYLRSPGGTRHELPMGIQSGKYTLRVEQTDLLIYLGEPSPYSVNRELYIEMIPASGSYIGSGIWQFILEPVEVSVGQYYFYLPSAAGRNERTGFTAPTPQVTLTIPSTSAKVITVGAYDSTYNSYADFSGRGYEGINRTIGVVTAGLAKPDLAAPGVNLPAPDLYGGYQSVTGTSFATPVVSGSAALLMEWGIVKGNDSFLYGEKIKAYLRRGAQPIRGENVYPNNKVGFGALCTAKSLPI